MESSKTLFSSNIEDLPIVAAQLLADLKYTLILFKGDLGAGKTTLVKELLRQLGSDDQGSSPSYSLINEYQLKEGKLYHLDLYRLNTVEEAFALGLEDILYSGHYCMVEWPELILDYIDPPFHLVNIEIEEGHRKITISSYNN